MSFKKTNPNPKLRWTQPVGKRSPVANYSLARPAREGGKSVSDNRMPSAGRLCHLRHTLRLVESLRQLNIAGQRNVARGTTDENFVFAFFGDPASGTDVVIGKGVLTQHDGNLLPFSRLQKHFRKPFQFLDRPEHTRVDRLHVNFGDFGTGAAAGVGELELDRQGQPGRATVLDKIQIRVGKVRVREAVAEGKQRFDVLRVIPAVTDEQAFLINNRAFLTGIRIQ